jgi:hypothetical protein
MTLCVPGLLPRFIRSSTVDIYIKHRFCPVRGIHPYGEGVSPKGGHTAAINIRCLDGIDFASIPVTHFDGRSL